MSGERSASARVLDDYYTKHYERVHSTRCVGGASAVLQRPLERGRRDTNYPITLDLGAGNLEPHPFVEHPHDQYIADDIRIPSKSQRFVQDVVAERSLHFLAIDALRIPFQEHSVDRIVAGCLLMHHSDPLDVLNEWQRVCRPDVDPDRRLRVRFFPSPAIPPWNFNAVAIFSIEPRCPRT